MTAYTTLNKIHSSQTSPSTRNIIIEALLNGLGKTHTDDEPLTLEKVFDVVGLDRAIQCLGSLDDKWLKNIVLFAADCAEHVLPIFENRFPYDKRPRNAIGAARGTNPKTAAIAYNYERDFLFSYNMMKEKSSLRDAYDNRYEKEIYKKDRLEEYFLENCRQAALAACQAAASAAGNFGLGLSQTVACAAYHASKASSYAIRAVDKPFDFKDAKTIRESEKTHQKLLFMKYFGEGAIPSPWDMPDTKDEKLHAIYKALHNLQYSRTRDDDENLINEIKRVQAELQVQYRLHTGMAY